MAIDVDALWDHGNPKLSEDRFIEALELASPDEQFLLRTQIARSYGIRKDFETAQRLLALLEPELDSATEEAKIRYWLELGRTYSSTTHSRGSVGESDRELAREAYMKAYDLAIGSDLDHLAIDALHMMTMVDTDADSQVKWNLKALEVMEGSDQPKAKKWEGSLRNNMGYAFHLAGRYDEAISQFELSLLARQAASNVEGVRIAKWMIGWTFRSMDRYSEALVIQLALEKEWEEDGKPDPYVFEELEHLYRALGEDTKADLYSAKLDASRPG